jgi:hypothetical protein
MRDLAQDIKDSGVGVWHYGKQDFVSFIPCPGEKRVRLDVFDGLHNYGVFPVEYHEVRIEGSTTHTRFTVMGERELSDWQIDLS